MSDSILNKIIELQEDQKRAEINPQELVNLLLSELNVREREVLNARYGLDRADYQTLEAIGKNYGITRERVRQIENNALRKAVQKEGRDEILAGLLSIVLKEIDKGGYIRLEDSLLDDILKNSVEPEIDRNCLLFVFNKFLTGHIEPIDVIYTERAWRIKNKDISHYSRLVDGIKNILEKKNQPMHLSEILEGLKREIMDEKLNRVAEEVQDWERAVDSYLQVSKHFKKNLFDKWGLNHWRTVNPKRMRDKIHLVMQKYNEPLHYKTIAQKINNEQFDNKRAHPATIHNELISDSRFVLIGRGIYALREWGYKPGVIAEVIEEVISAAGVPLTKEEIVKEVLKKRIVKKGSVNLTLANKDKFERLADGRYTLKKKL